MMKQLISMALCLAALNAYAQEPQRAKALDNLAFGITETEWIDRLMPMVPGLGVDPREALLRQNIKSYLMPVRKSENWGTELSYALASCLEFYVNLDNNYKDNLSPDYIRLSLSQSGQPIKLKDALVFLSQTGTVSAAIMPYGSTSIPNAVYAAQKYRIKNYLHLFWETTRERQRVFEVKKALMQGNPVLVELRAGPEFPGLLRTPNWVPPKTAEQSYPLLVVGYDEEEQSFEVMSSWGSNWGLNGYMEITYKDFGNYAQNAYVLLPK